MAPSTRHEPTRAEERELIPVLIDALIRFSKNSYVQVDAMLQAADNHIEDREWSNGKCLFLEFHPVQNLGDEHDQEIEVSISVRSDVAHVRCYLYFCPDGRVYPAPMVSRGPVTTCVDYDVCDIEETKGWYPGAET